MKRFADLSEQEVLALAISNETEDNRIYRSFADGLRGSYPDTAAMSVAGCAIASAAISAASVAAILA